MIEAPIRATKDEPVRWGVVSDNIVFLHPDANLCVCGAVLSEMFFSSSKWWLCARGHRFETAVGSLAGRTILWSGFLVLCPEMGPPR
jgi:hypothetical protein